MVALTDVTNRAFGIKQLAWSPVGPAWADYDQDGWVDLCNDGLWRNNGDGTFSRPWFSGIDGWGVFGVWGDYNSDGFPDLIQVHYSGGRVSLYRNRGNGTFEDVTQAAGLSGFSLTGTSPFGGAWLDVGSDGTLDFVYTAGWWQTGPLRAWLFRNRGNGTFSVEAYADFANNRGAATGDFDDDNDMDIVIPSYRQSSITLLNQGANLVLGESLSSPGFAIGAATADFDRDGRIDIILVGQHSPPVLYLNKGGKFGSSSSGWGMGSSSSGGKTLPSPGLNEFLSVCAADADNDGLPDFYATQEAGEGGVDQLYMNLGGSNFGNVAPTRLKSGYGCAWADIDNDGDMDLLTGGKLFRNEGYTGNSFVQIWLKVRKGQRANIYGASVTLVAGGRRYREEISGGHAHGQNSHVVHFGLGKTPAVSSVTIRWPSGQTQQVRAPAVNRRITVEGP